GGAPSPVRPQELEKKEDASCGSTVEQAFRVASRQREQQSEHRRSETGAGAASDLLKTEKEQRKARRRGSHAPPVPEKHVGRKSPCHRAEKARHLRETTVEKEQIGGKEGKEDRKSAGKGPRLGHR